MGSRVLLAEKNDTIRGVAETVLRQNGFDVISVGSADKAYEVLEFSNPDLILIDCSLAGNDNQPAYQKIQNSAKTATLPMLLLADQYDESLGVAADKVVIRPFDPADLVQRISLTMGGSTKAAAGGVNQLSGVDPLSGADLSDGFLDQALGLDDIEVTSSEDMNATGQTRIPHKNNSEVTKISGIGDFSKGKAANDQADSGRVESLMIRDDNSDIKAAPSNLVPETEDLSASASLQLSDDQYGLTDPDSFSNDSADSADHDYNWFVSSMKSDSDTPAPNSGSAASSDDSLSIAGTADLINPETPGPATPTPSVQASSSEGSMDKFIDEFRDEVERLGDSELDSIVLSQAAPEMQTADQSGGIAVESISVPEGNSWEDSIENVTPEHLRLFTTALANRIADKIAGLILARLDQDKLLRLIKDEIVEQSRKKS